MSDLQAITIFFSQIAFSRTMACQDLASMSPTEVKTFFDSYDTVLTDCDGVLWKGKFTTLIQKLFQIFSNKFYLFS